MKTLREKNYWQYSFNKYIASMNASGYRLRTNYIPVTIQRNASEFANKVDKKFSDSKPVIKFNTLGVPFINGKEFRW